MVGVHTWASEPLCPSGQKPRTRQQPAAGAGASVALTATMAVAARGNPVISLVVVGLVGVFVAGLLAGLRRLSHGSWKWSPAGGPRWGHRQAQAVQQLSAWHRPTGWIRHRSAAIYRTRPKLCGAFRVAFVQFEATASTDRAAHRIAPGPGQDRVLAPRAQSGYVCPSVPGSRLTATAATGDSA